MNGIPDSLDPAIFKGATLELISFAAYQVDLNFLAGPPILVSIAGAYDHHGPDGAWRDEVRQLPVSETRLTQLVNTDVTEAAVEDPRALLLSFSNGQRLRVRDDTEQYESFQISHGDNHWVV